MIQLSPAACERLDKQIATIDEMMADEYRLSTKLISGQTAQEVSYEYDEQERYRSASKRGTYCSPKPVVNENKLRTLVKMKFHLMDMRMRYDLTVGRE